MSPSHGGGVNECFVARWSARDALRAVVKLCLFIRTSSFPPFRTGRQEACEQALASQPLLLETKLLPLFPTPTLAFPASQGRLWATCCFLQQKTSSLSRRQEGRKCAKDVSSRRERRTFCVVSSALFSVCFASNRKQNQIGKIRNKYEKKKSGPPPLVDVERSRGWTRNSRGFCFSRWGGNNIKKTETTLSTKITKWPSNAESSRPLPRFTTCRSFFV